MRFLGLELAGTVPDARTVWAFREALKEHKLVEPLFERLSQALGALGVALKSGQIIDATFVPVPVQRNGREDNALGHTSQSHERAYRHQPLSTAQEVCNTAKSRVRARVEHVCGHMQNAMGGIFLRTIGAARAAVGVGLMNLTYNLSRVETLIRTQGIWL